MFFWFNTAYLVCIITCMLLYESFAGAWVILPLYWTFERAVISWIKKRASPGSQTATCSPQAAMIERSRPGCLSQKRVF
jgi:hypothetical protein